jgi:peptidoglycan/xylan/chitin deacetylase (PgdA/CDA1 family)
MKTSISRRDLGLGAAAAACALIGAAARSEPLATECTADCVYAAHVCGLEDGAFTHGARASNRLALSFDACPTSLQPSFAPEVADFLEAQSVPVTFFVSGRWAQANPGHFRRLARVPFFEIALHGHRHPRLINATAAVIRSEIVDGRAALTELGAEPAPLFRPPYGDLPPILPEIARATGVLPITWDAALGDPDPDRTAELMERDAIRWVQAGSIIIMHINGRGYGTAETVRDLVPLFRARGYAFAKVSELVAGCPRLRD